MKNYYFIDSENVNDNWLMLLELTDDTDVLIVFYTPNSPHMSYPNLVKLTKSNRDIQYIECFEGNNGLDFQLVSELGFQLSKDPDAEYNIMSNDTGFDSVVNYWKKKDYLVKRINVNYCKLLLKKQQLEQAEAKEPEDVLETAVESVAESVETAETVQPAAESVEVTSDVPVEEVADAPEETTPEETTPEETTPVEADLTKAEVDMIIQCFGKEDLSSIHNALIHIYGAGEGMEIYKKVKVKSYTVKGKKLTREQKLKAYCDIVFAHSAFAEQPPKGFADFMLANQAKWKNLNSLRPAILKEYGDDKGMKYYALFKPHVKIIVTI